MRFNLIVRTKRRKTGPGDRAVSANTRVVFFFSRHARVSATRQTSRPRAVHVSGYRVIPCGPCADVFKSHPGTRRCRRTERLCVRVESKSQKERIAAEPRDFLDRFAAGLRNGFRDAVDRDDPVPPTISNADGVFETREVLTEIVRTNKTVNPKSKPLDLAIYR